MAVVGPLVDTGQTHWLATLNTLQGIRKSIVYSLIHVLSQVESRLLVVGEPALYLIKISTFQRSY